MQTSLDFCLSKLEELPVMLSTTEAVCWLIGSWPELHPSYARRLVDKAGIGLHPVVIRLDHPRIPDGVYAIDPYNSSWALFLITYRKKVGGVL